MYVIDGDKVASSEYPAAVTIVRRDGSQCGGGVIGPNAVLTAAHCLFNLTDGGVTAIYYDADGNLKETRSIHAEVHPDLKAAVKNSGEDIRKFYAQFTSMATIMRGNHSYTAIAVDKYEYRGPAGEKIAPLDFAIVVFAGAPFPLHYPLFTGPNVPRDVYFVGKGVFTDDLERASSNAAYRGKNRIGDRSEAVLITSSDPKLDGNQARSKNSSSSNSAAALGDSGIPLWSKVPGEHGRSTDVTLAIHSSGGYWSQADGGEPVYYGRFSAMPNPTNFTRENIWIPVASAVSLTVIKNALEHKQFPANIVFYPEHPKFPIAD
jgi:hypothetical protein